LSQVWKKELNGFGVLLNLSEDPGESEFPDPALPFGGDGVGFMKNRDLVSKMHVLEEHFLRVILPFFGIPILTNEREGDRNICQRGRIMKTISRFSSHR
jgi:hypothetical protein